VSLMPPRTPPALRAADERRAIVAATRRLLAESGPEAVTTRNIAEASGATTMAIYSRFGGKEGVVEAIFTEGFSELTESLRRVRITASPAKDLERLVSAYRQFALDQPSLYSVMFERVIPEFRPTADSSACAINSFDVLAEFCARLSGLNPNSEAARRSAYSIWSLMHGLVVLELSGMGDHLTGESYAVAFERSIQMMIAAMASGAS
jgi:AcrR family transcriptional regulator